MPVAVVIPCRNEARSIRELLTALAAQTAPPTEVVIVDDGSTDGSGRLVQEWADAHPDFPVRLVPGPGRGPGPAMNAGIATTEADIIVRLDGHSVPDAGYVERSVALVANPRVGVAGGGWEVVPGAPTAIGRAIAAVVTHPLGSGGARYRHPQDGGHAPQEVETVPFGAFRREVWTQVGGFDESLAANEDYDFNYRVRRLGLAVVFDAGIRSRYVARPALGALGRQYFRYGIGKRQMLRKDARALHWRQVPPILLLPWVVLTGLWCVAAPSSLSVGAACMYPLGLVAGAAHVARRGVHAPAALAALATLQMCWSAGFWRAMWPLPRSGNPPRFEG